MQPQKLYANAFDSIKNSASVITLSISWLLGHLPCRLQVSLNQWTAPNYVTILFLFVQTFISFILFNMPNPFPNCFHNSAYRLALLKIFLKLKTRIYTVKMVLNRVIYKYHNSWKGAKRYRAVVQCNRHILRTALVHFMCNQHISTRS